MVNFILIIHLVIGAISLLIAVVLNAFVLGTRYYPYIGNAIAVKFLMGLLQSAGVSFSYPTITFWILTVIAGAMYYASTHNELCKAGWAAFASAGIATIFLIISVIPFLFMDLDPHTKDLMGIGLSAMWPVYGLISAFLIIRRTPMLDYTSENPCIWLFATCGWALAGYIYVGKSAEAMFEISAAYFHTEIEFNGVVNGIVIFVSIMFGILMTVLTYRKKKTTIRTAIEDMHAKEQKELETAAGHMMEVQAELVSLKYSIHELASRELSPAFAITISKDQDEVLEKLDEVQNGYNDENYADYKRFIRLKNMHVNEIAGNKMN